MKTMTFTPHSDLDKLDADFKAKWITALMVSDQHTGSLCNDDLTAYCCLGIAMIVEGVDFHGISRKINEDHNLELSRLEHPNDLSGHFNGENSIIAEILIAATDQDGRAYEFYQLNDEYLTHAQIAELLKGNTVTVEVKS